MVRIVGLTGGIGSGKSVVSRKLEELGAAVVDADLLARDAVAQNTPGFDAIVRRFGQGVLGADGALDRKVLGAIAFRDAGARADLNAIVHPIVGQLAAARFQALIAAGADLIIYDVPLLYETGLEHAFPEVIVVDAPAATIRKRLAQRDGLDLAAIDARIAAQLPLEDKVDRAAYVIDNSGSLAETHDQVGRLWARLMEGVETA